MVSGCKATAGCVAYVGISYQTQVLQAGLGYAALGNGKGQYVLPDTRRPSQAEAAYFVKKTPANGTISLIYGPVNDGYPIVNYEYAIVSNDQSSLLHGQEHPLGPRVGDQPQAGNSSSYLNQVNFQPLPAKVWPSRSSRSWASSR